MQLWCWEIKVRHHNHKTIQEWVPPEAWYKSSIQCFCQVSCSQKLYNYKTVNFRYIFNRVKLEIRICINWCLSVYMFVYVCVFVCWVVSACGHRCRFVFTIRGDDRCPMRRSEATEQGEGHGHGRDLKKIRVSKSHFRAFKNDFLWN